MASACNTTSSNQPFLILQNIGNDYRDGVQVVGSHFVTWVVVTTTTHLNTVTQSTKPQSEPRSLCLQVLTQVLKFSSYSRLIVDKSIASSAATAQRVVHVHLFYLSDHVLVVLPVTFKLEGQPRCCSKYNSSYLRSVMQIRPMCVSLSLMFQVLYIYVHAFCILNFIEIKRHRIDGK